MAKSRWVELTGWGPVRVEDIMHRDVRRTSADTTLQDAARKMRDMNVGCLPVWEGDALVGIITDRDITCRAIAGADDPASTMVRDVMSKDVAFCYEDQLAAEAALIMEKKHVHRLPVLDRSENMVGILTLSDLSLHTPQLAGEVVRAVSPHNN